MPLAVLILETTYPSEQALASINFSIHPVIHLKYKDRHKMVTRLDELLFEINFFLNVAL